MPPEYRPSAQKVRRDVLGTGPARCGTGPFVPCRATRALGFVVEGLGWERENRQLECELDPCPATRESERGSTALMSTSLPSKNSSAKTPNSRMTSSTARGYEVSFHGLNQWNGVAIASRIGLEDMEIGFANVPAFGDESVVEARAISAT